MNVLWLSIAIHLGMVFFPGQDGITRRQHGEMIIQARLEAQELMMCVENGGVLKELKTLVGGLEHFIFSIIYGNNHPN